jgi:hypothetical protein
MVSPVPAQGPNPPIDGVRPTYRAIITGLAAVTGCTDLVTITSNNASQIVRVLRVEFSGTIATTALELDVLGIIRSSADLTGTSTSPTPIQFDANDPAATAVVKAYTANPGTLGTAVGTIRSDKAELVIAPAVPDRLVWDFGTRPGKAVTLRGIGQVFAVNLNAIAIGTATLIDCAIEWTESLT